MHHQIRRIGFDNERCVGVADYVGHVAAKEGGGVRGEIGGAGVVFASTNDSYAPLLAFVEGFQERGDELADFEEEVTLC